jgi:hypothetical protein
MVSGATFNSNLLIGDKHKVYMNISQISLYNSIILKFPKTVKRRSSGYFCWTSELLWEAAELSHCAASRSILAKFYSADTCLDP